jgi:hypothetical protein
LPIEALDPLIYKESSKEYLLSVYNLSPFLQLEDLLSLYMPLYRRLKKAKANRPYIYCATALGKEKKEGKPWLAGKVNLVIEYIKKD